MSVQEENLRAIAEAIRQKEGTAGAIPAREFARRILALPSGGGSAAFAVPLTVTVDPGAQVTAVNGEHTVTGTSGTEGTVVLILPAPGSWTVTAALGEKEKSEIIQVAEGYTAEFSLSSRLPGGYTEVEYITPSAANCGINTGVTIDFYRTRILMDLIPGKFSSKVQYWTSALPQSSRYYFMLMRSSIQNQIRLNYYTRGVNSYAVTFSDNQRLLVDLDFWNDGGRSGQLKITGDNINKNFSLIKNSFRMTNPIYLFAYDSTSSPLQGNLYSAKIYHEGVIVRDFVPCINPMGQAGLYDLVDGGFYANALTGTVTPGPAV